MANRKKRKQPIDGAWFKRVCSQRGMSMNGLAKVAGWSSRQIRDGVNHGEMTPELLSSCARALNVHPAYLAGKYGWTLKLEIMKDAEVREHWLKTAMAPDSHPYATLNRKRLTYTNTSVIPSFSMALSAASLCASSIKSRRKLGTSSTKP